jgi:hypothetical protein
VRVRSVPVFLEFRPLPYRCLAPYENAIASPVASKFFNASLHRLDNWHTLNSRCFSLKFACHTPTGRYWSKTYFGLLIEALNIRCKTSACAQNLWWNHNTPSRSFSIASPSEVRSVYRVLSHAFGSVRRSSSQLFSSCTSVRYAWMPSGTLGWESCGTDSCTR